MLFRWCGLDELARAAQREPIAVPARGEVIEDITLAVFVAKILQNAQHRVAAQAAKARHAHGDAAGGKTLGQNVALNGDGLLTVQARGRGVEHQIDGKAGTALLVAAQKHTVIMQHRFAPDLRSVQPALTGGDALGLLVDEQAVSNLLAQARERALVQIEVAREGGAVQLGLILSLLVKALRVRADELVRRARAPCEPQVAA